MSAAIRDKADYHPAPVSLAERLRASVPAEPGEAPRASRSAVAALAAAFAAVAVLAWVAATRVMRPGEDERLAQEVLASHVRATLRTGSTTWPRPTSIR